MPLPLAIPLALLAGSAIASAGANLYSQQKQRELYRYQRQGYERMLRDYNRRNPNRPIRYPEVGIPGRIRALDTGISQSYLSSVGTSSHLIGSLAGGTLHTRSVARSLYGKSSGRSSRYL